MKANSDVIFIRVIMENESMSSCMARDILKLVDNNRIHNWKTFKQHFIGGACCRDLLVSIRISGISNT